MDEKQDCKIVEDLLPNYIEKLTNEQTNNYIEQHIKTCSECRDKLERMKRNFKIQNEKRDNREVKYIKKFNIKFKILRNILIAIVIIYMAIVLRRFIILSDVGNKFQQTIRNDSNYYMSRVTYSKDNIQVVKRYYDKGKKLLMIDNYAQDINKLSHVIYVNGDEKIYIAGNQENNYLMEFSENVERMLDIRPMTYIDENYLSNFILNLYTAITSTIDEVELYGKKCYIIKNNDKEDFIDAETGLLIKYTSIGGMQDYSYEFNKVTNIEKPDLTNVITSNEK